VLIASSFAIKVKVSRENYSVCREKCYFRGLKQWNVKMLKEVQPGLCNGSRREEFGVDRRGA
jgi:hypothetical protein